MQGWGLWLGHWLAGWTQGHTVKVGSAGGCSYVLSPATALGPWDDSRYTPLVSLPLPLPFSHSAPWRDRLYDREALTALGAADTADSCSKYIQRHDYKQHM